MGRKVSTISEEAYQMLRTLKKPGETFTEVIERIARRNSLLETLKVLLDKKTMRRIKLGEQQFRRKQYVTVKGPKEVRRVLST
jgi:predicted CopG family antitoxin